MLQTRGIGRPRSNGAHRWAVIGGVLLLPCVAAQASDLIQNHGQPDYFLYSDDGVARAGTVPANLPSARWSVVPSGDGYYFLYNRARQGGVLHLERDALAVGPTDPPSDHAMWRLVPVGDDFYLICNRAVPDRCLYLERGRLVSGTVEPDWQSAMWSVPEQPPAAANGGGLRNGHGAAARPSPPPTSLPPVVAAARRRPAEPLPDFPWPPPPATRLVLPRAAVVERPGVASQADAADVLVEALEQRGYLERGFFRVPGGFALATKLERIDENGEPAPEASRWAQGNVPAEFSLAAILKRLAGVPPGRFRVLVFVVTPEPFSSSGRPVAGDVAEGWVTAGFNKLPREFRQVPVDADTACTVLVFEFERLPVDDVARQVERHDARRHLQRSGLASVLQINW
jgi:hypothetical protein